ncbi:hypothetical protein RFI_27017 [Reticulomyxa filosa]|uniref:Uncharacterized protein n=1 Tax=Reticulomyxa filosa TaxID=46433 RepID=X6M8Q7_RETFI|nr:hypothetical protein RFI_27017 [Reticulomyxa filosa]|eukprot:ETO10363.1 hypothetical protein RFI_27017 [Reticulomyxa filosa]
MRKQQSKNPPLLSFLFSHLFFFSILKIEEEEKRTKRTILEPVPLAGGVIQKPFGQVRLNCLELLTMSADLANFKCAKVLAKLTHEFWDAIVEMAFIHKTNNFFLCHFRRLIHLCMIFRRRYLKYLFVERNLLDRFVDFYNNDAPRTTLHAYLLQMLWDMYHHDQREPQPMDNEENKESETHDETDQEDCQSDAGSASSVIINDDGDGDGDANSNSEEVKREDSTDIATDNDENDGDNSKENDQEEDNESETFENNGEFVLKSNLSNESEDQWDIVQFFEHHSKWSNFVQVISHEIETQTNACPQIFSQGGGGGACSSELDALFSQVKSKDFQLFNPRHCLCCIFSVSVWGFLFFPSFFFPSLFFVRLDFFSRNAFVLKHLKTKIFVLFGYFKFVDANESVSFFFFLPFFLNVCLVRLARVICGPKLKSKKPCHLFF